MDYKDLENPDKLDKNDIVIAIMGPTGVGKSNIIDKLTGEDKRVGHRLTSCTTVVGAVRIKGHTEYNDRIVLVDTPGFDDTKQSDEEILRIIAEWLVTTYNAEVCLHGIIYVQRITDVRMSGAHHLNLQMFAQLCGRKTGGKVLFVTTMWDDIETFETRDHGVQRESDLKNDYWRNLGLGESSERFYNTSDSAWNIINTLLRRPVERTALQLQEEICRFGRAFEQSKAAQALYIPLPTILPKHDSTAKLRQNSGARRNTRHFETNLSPSFRSGDIVILIMGAGAAGKSTFINALLGEQHMKVSHGLLACTTTIEVAISDSFSGSPDFRGRRLVLVDTPGFDEPYGEDTAVLRKISEWLATAYRQKMIFGGVVYLHDITQTRYRPRNLEICQQMCGEFAFKKVVLGTTKWGVVPQATGATRERELIEKHWSSMIEKGSVVHRFHISRESAWSFVDPILQAITQPKLRDIPLQIQTELIVDKKILSETRAGKELHSRLEGELDRQKKVVRRMTKSGDPDDQDQLYRAQTRMEELAMEVQGLKIPLRRRIRPWFLFLGGV